MSAVPALPAHVPPPTPLSVVVVAVAFGPPPEVAHATTMTDRPASDASTMTDSPRSDTSNMTDLHNSSGALIATDLPNSGASTVSSRLDTDDASNSIPVSRGGSRNINWGEANSVA